METIENVLVVGDKRVITDLFHPSVVGKNGLVRRRALIMPGAAKKGYVKAMRVLGFDRAGIHASHFTDSLLTSSATWVGIAYEAGQSHTVPEFFHKLTWYNRDVLSAILRGDVFAVEYLRNEVLRTIDFDAFRRSTVDSTIAVSDLHGGVHLHKAHECKDARELTELMTASSALIPWLYGRNIKGTLSVDGGFTIPSTVLRWLRKVLKSMRHNQEIDLLYVASHPHPDMYNKWYENFIFEAFVSVFLSHYPDLARGARTIDLKYRKILELAERVHKNMRLCLIAPMPDENILHNEWRPHVLRARGELTLKRTEAFLQALKPTVEV